MMIPQCDVVLFYFGFVGFQIVVYVGRAERFGNYVVLEFLGQGWFKGYFLTRATKITGHALCTWQTSIYSEVS